MTNRCIGAFRRAQARITHLLAMMTTVPVGKAKITKGRAASTLPKNPTKPVLANAIKVDRSTRT
jgi:hypothetical protein